MATTRRILTNFSKGELSPLLEGRPDLAAYSEGGKTLENWLLLRQGGITRRPGLRFVREVKLSNKDTVILPFEFSVDDAFIIEMGEGYDRFYKNRAIILAFSGGPPVEVVNPYLESELRSVHFTQSADVLFQFHVNYQQRRLSRISDTSWALSPIIYRPPPSFEVDTDISGGATLTPGAVTGNTVIFTASAAVFLEGDVGRIIVFGASRAVITMFGASAGDTASPNDQVRADILDAFPDVAPPPGPDVLTGWKLRLSPQATLDPNKKEPVGAQVTLVAGLNSFRVADVDKFIVIYGGLIRITNFDSATQVKGELLSVMSVTAADPPFAPAGSWTLEEASWSGIHGFPRTGEFVQGRLVQASTLAQPTVWWMSDADNFDAYAIGTQANNALDYTIAARKVNRIQWIADHVDLFFGTAGAEFKATSGKTDEPFGGDIIPFVRSTSFEGSAAIQPIILSKRLLFVDRSRKKVFAVLFNIEEDSYKAIEITGASEHITGTGIRLGHIAFTIRPDPRAYFIREDGQLLALTFFTEEKVIGFTRIVTNGTFESVAVIPQPGGAPDQVWVVVKRTINGQVKRYVEFFENEATDAVPGPSTFLETTGNGQSWLKGFLAQFPADDPVSQEWNTNFSIPVFISDTTVFKFHSGAGFLRYRRSLDGGVTWSADQAVTAEIFGPDSFDLRTLETVVDPLDPLPEHLVFIALGVNKVWVSRNVLQPNPALATWAKISLSGTGVLAMNVRGKQVCVIGGNLDAPPHLRIHCSNDYGITFPNVVLISPIQVVGGQVCHQQIASPGENIWVVLNVLTENAVLNRTTDNGVTWAIVGPLLTGSGTLDRGCILNVNDTIMVAVYGGTIYRSTDAGITWIEVKSGVDIVTLGYFGNGIISGISEATFTGPTGGSIEWRSNDYGLTWVTAPVDAGLDILATRNVSRMAVWGSRGVVVGRGSLAGGSSSTWYSPSTLVSQGPGESIDFADRPWTALQTDSAVVYVSATPTKIVPGLSHLEGETVEVVADGSFRGTKVVSMGSITMDEEYSQYEVGLHYTSTGVTMRPVIADAMIEGLPRSWNSLYLRLKDTVGGKVNDTAISYPASPLTTLVPFTGDRRITNKGWDSEGRVTFTQDEPYPMTVLAIFGTLSVGNE